MTALPWPPREPLALYARGHEEPSGAPTAERPAVDAAA